MTWTNTGGGDHNGDDWTPSNSTVVSGIHYNIGTFAVTGGYNIYVSVATPVRNTTYNPLTVYADTIDISGTMHGELRGFAGGTDEHNGSGPGSGSGDSASGGGAGYGGAGGNATSGGAGGNAYGVSDSAFIQRGSGGGGGSASGTGFDRRGGNGGGSIALYGNTVTVSGTITAYGGGGSASVASGGGGGSGGGIFICGNAITVSGIINTNGGSGGNGTLNDGGRGGGGRIKMLYNTLNTVGSTLTAAQGTFGGSVGVGNGTSTTTLIGQCTTTRAYGQTFQYTEQGVLSKITLYVNTVNTSGDFTLKLWDDTSKSTELASKTVTISSTGIIEFEFSAWELILEDDEYYFEVNPDAIGNIELGVYGNLYDTTGAYYDDGFIVTYFDTYYILTGINRVKNPVVYNTADTTVKSSLANLMLIGMIHRINADNTGTIQYTDNFTTNKYLGDYTAISGVTHDAVNDELDITDTGYIYYKIDTKYTITGMPTITATIDITAGTPTIQISSDAVTWYDIDTAIIDDISTEYDLDTAANLSLKGLTTFYLRFDCAGVGTNTCSIKTFTLNVDIVTVDVPNPVINTGTTNTFKCEQDADSGLNCEIELIYRDRKWT